MNSKAFRLPFAATFRPVRRAAYRGGETLPPLLWPAWTRPSTVGEAKIVPAKRIRGLARLVGASGLTEPMQTRLFSGLVRLGPCGIFVLLVLVMEGCGQSGLRSPIATADAVAAQGAHSDDQPASVLQATGDWNDVEASVLAGADKAETVVRSFVPAAPDSDVRCFDLVTVRDQSGLLCVRRVSDGQGPDHESAMLRFECEIGKGSSRDIATERWVLDEVVRRLSQLRGVEFAPAR